MITGTMAQPQLYRSTDYRQVLMSEIQVNEVR